MKGSVDQSVSRWLAGWCIGYNFYCMHGWLVSHSVSYRQSKFRQKANWLLIYIYTHRDDSMLYTYIFNIPTYLFKKLVLHTKFVNFIKLAHPLDRNVLIL